MAYEAGDARIRVIPDASRFLTDLENDLKRKRAEFAVDVTADTSRATTEIDAWIARQSGRDVRVDLDVDLSRAERSLASMASQLGASGGGIGSALGALKFPAILAGVGELPAATLALTNVAGALQQLAGAGLVIPGVIGGIAASFATVKLGVSGVSDAFTALQDASDGSAESLQKADEALKGLAPSAREAVTAASDVVNDLREALQQPIQQNLFDGVGEDLRRLVSADLPILQRGLGGISTALNQNLRQVLDSLGSETSQGLLDRILGNTADAQSRVTAAVDPLITAIGTLTAAGTDALPRLADGLTGVADRFNAFITEADQDGSLDRWINDGITGFRQVGETVLNIGKSLGGLTEAAGGDGGLLKWLEDASSRLATFLNSTEGQNQLRDWFAEGREQLGELRDLAMDVGPTLAGVFNAGKDAADVLVPVLRDIVNFINNDIPGGAQTVVQAFLAWQGLKFAGGIIGEIGSISNALGGGKFGLLGKLGLVTAAIATIQNFNGAGQRGPNDGPNFGGQGAATVGGAAIGAQIAGVPGAIVGAGVGAASAPVVDFLNPPGPAQNGVLPGAPNTSSGPATVGGIPIPGLIVPSRAKGGPTPSTRGYGPTGGFLAEVHPDEWVLPAHARAAVGDDALWALTRGRSFAPGGTVDEFGNPVQPSGPIAPNPMQSVGGGIASAFLSGLGGVGRNVSALAGGLGGLGQGTGVDAGAGVAEGSVHGLLGGADPGPAAAPTPTPGGSVLGGLGSLFGLGGGAPAGDGQPKIMPGIAGLFQAGGNPDMLAQWGTQTGDWLGTFAAKTLTSFGSTLYQGVLGAFGLENSILSPNNSYFQAVAKSAGFFAGEDGPLAFGSDASTSSGGRSGSTPKAATDKQLREGGQSVERADQRVAEITQRIAELPGDAKDSQRLSLNNDLANAKQDAADARADLTALQSRGVAAGGAAGGTTPGVFDPSALPRGVGNEDRLQVYTIAAKRAISAAFPQITDIGGYRQDPLKWHPGGYAIDVMIPGGDTHGGRNPQGKALGDQINAFVMANKSALHVDYVLWQTDSGGNHYNHLHVNTTGGGYPPKGYAVGGGVPGTGAGDIVPAMLTPGEHVLTTYDVAKMGGQAGVYAFREALHFAPGGAVPTGAVIRPLPPTPAPRPPQIQRLQPRPQPATPGGPSRPTSPTPPTPPTAGPAPAPTATPPVAPAQAAPAPTDTPPRGFTPGAAPVAAAPANVSDSLNHNLPALSKGISSGASAIGQALSTAIGVAGGAAGGFGGGALGAIGPYVAGLVQQGGKIVDDVFNVGSSFLVGNITPGTTENAYGETLRPEQRIPLTAADRMRGGGGGNTTWNIQAGYRPDDIIDAIRLKENQDRQARLARFGG